MQALTDGLTDGWKNGKVDRKTNIRFPFTEFNPECMAITSEQGPN